MRHSREETAPQDLPGDLWHALAQLHHTHPDPVGRVGPLARPAGLLSFAAADDTILAARVQLSGAESMREVSETLRAITGGMHAHFTGPGVALEVTLGRRQELPLHEAHAVGLTRLFGHAAGTVGARSTPGGGLCFHCGGTGRARPLWEPAAEQA
ncbi:hypothetical protein [Streptomyces hydrogenans]|uniref:hypothetical protein n=1 Tax=Streptomyces hydrogenans TaxID=1873719 RepID=UPI0035DE8727